MGFVVVEGLSKVEAALGCSLEGAMMAALGTGGGLRLRWDS